MVEKLCQLRGLNYYFHNMRLINAITLTLEHFTEPVPVQYAILSHTWEDQEVTFEDLQRDPSVAMRKRGYRKIEMTCRLARERDMDYVWVDTCCIDKSSSAELSEAINSMFAWYSNATVCLAFLFDLPAGGPGLDSIPAALEKCRWFTRGWTLQELIAPSNLFLLDSSWTVRGTKREFTAQLEAITGVDQNVLLEAAALPTIPLGQAHVMDIHA